MSSSGLFPQIEQGYSLNMSLSILVILYNSDTTKIYSNCYMVSFPIPARCGNNRKQKSNLEVVISCEATKQPGIIFTNIFPVIPDLYTELPFKHCLMSGWVIIGASLCWKDKPMLSTRLVSYLNSEADQAPKAISVTPSARCSLGSSKDY